MEAGLAATGALYVGAGAVVARWPYRIARFSERLDSRGSTRDWSEVEPSGWKVVATRAVGVAVILLGALVWGWALA